MEIGKTHVLLVPVGGFFTIDARTAGEVCDQVRTRVIIPMHYKTDSCDIPIAPVNHFLKIRGNVEAMAVSEVEFMADRLPEGKTIVLQHAL